MKGMYMKEKIQVLAERIRHQKNANLYVLIGLIAVSYLFFFSSKLWASDGGKAKNLTPINQITSYAGREIKIKSWLYKEDTMEMQVTIEIYNKAYDGKDTYYFSASDRQGKEYSVEVTFQDGLIWILRITGVEADFRAIALHLWYEGAESSQWLYTNENSVERTENIVWYHTPEEYRIAALKSEIETYKATIEDLKHQIEENRLLLIRAEEQVQNLEQRIKTAVSSDKKRLETEISNLYNDMNNLTVAIKNMETQISELEKAIVEDEQTMEELQK